MAERRFFDSSRRSRASAVGLVARRGGAPDQVHETFEGILAVARLGAMAVGVDHEHALAGEPAAGEAFEPRGDGDAPV